MILEKNNLQTVQEWTKSYIELIALYVHPKNSNHLRSHLRARKALDHSRLGLENKFLENKAGQNFCVRQVYLTKSCQQNWGRVNQPFILSIHYNWGETVLWNGFFFIIFYFFHIDLGKNAVFHNCAIQIVLIQYSGRSQYAWDFSDFTYTASRFSLLTSAQFAVRAVPLIELRFKIIKNSSCLFFI